MIIPAITTTIKKTAAMAFFATCLQLPSLKWGPAALKSEMPGAAYFAAEMMNTNNGAHICKTPKCPHAKPCAKERFPEARIKSTLLPGRAVEPSVTRVAEYKPSSLPDSVTDVDGHVYHVVKIGKQRWLKENLKASKFSNGDPIAEFENSYDWPNASVGAWCYYERSSSYNYPYGKLYNWMAVVDPRNVCPAGFHVPTDVEFQTLSNYLGGNDTSGAHLKAVELWNEKDPKQADNTSGFTALPAGIRYRGGGFARGGSDGADFWTSTHYLRNTAICRVLYYNGRNFSRHNDDIHGGLSVRCVGN